VYRRLSWPVENSRANTRRVFFLNFLFNNIFPTVFLHYYILLYIDYKKRQSRGQYTLKLRVLYLHHIIIVYYIILLKLHNITYTLNSEQHWSPIDDSIVVGTYYIHPNNVVVSIANIMYIIYERTEVNHIML